MTLNGVTAIILRFLSPISISLQAKYVAVVEYRPILSINIVSVPVFHFWPLIIHRAARSLCDSWGTCYIHDDDVDDDDDDDDDGSVRVVAVAAAQ